MSDTETRIQCVPVVYAFYFLRKSADVETARLLTNRAEPLNCEDSPLVNAVADVVEKYKENKHVFLGCLTSPFPAFSQADLPGSS